MKTPLRLFQETVETPIGPLLLLTDGEGRLRALDWPDMEARNRRLLARHYGEGGFTVEDAAEPSAAAKAVQRYMGGDMTALDTLEVATGGTEFQRAVWAALRQIPVGQTLSYGGLAAKIGRPSAVRAVGLANGANPIGIVVPCHRVIGADASLTGFAGGVDRKRWLLEHEGVRLNP